MSKNLRKPRSAYTSSNDIVLVNKGKGQIIKKVEET